MRVYPELVHTEDVRLSSIEAPAECVEGLPAIEEVRAYYIKLKRVAKLPLVRQNQVRLDKRSRNNFSSLLWIGCSFNSSPLSSGLTYI